MSRVIKLEKSCSSIFDYAHNDVDIGFTLKD